MHVTNEAEAKGGTFAELIRLQTDFQAKLADETLRYLRKLQGMAGPSAAGTVIGAAGDVQVKASGRLGGTAVVALELENMQQVYCVVLPQLTPLVSQSGTIWLPVVDTGGGSLLVAPGAVAQITLTILVPENLTLETYRGALILQGFRETGIPVTIDIAKAEVAKPKEKEGGGILSKVIGPLGAAQAAKAAAPKKRKGGKSSPKRGTRTRR